MIFRLRITYNSRLRNLADTQADSVRTDCEIDDDLKMGKNYLQLMEPLLIINVKQMQQEMQPMLKLQ